MRLVIDVTLHHTEAELEKMLGTDAYAKSGVRQSDGLFEWWAKGAVYYVKAAATRWLKVDNRDDIKLVGFREVTTKPPAQ